MDKTGITGTILTDIRKVLRSDHILYSRENIIKSKINLQTERFRWTLCKEKHTFSWVTARVQTPQINKIKFSYQHSQNADKEPSVYSHKSNNRHLREKICCITVVNLIILFICEHLCEDICLHICILTWLIKVQGLSASNSF